MELGADKLLVITGEDVRALSLPHYLPLVRVLGCGYTAGAIRRQAGCLEAAVLEPLLQCGMSKPLQLSFNLTCTF